jgi:hypothetical protein
LELQKYHQEQGLSAPTFAYLDDLTLLFTSILDGINGIKMIKEFGPKYGLLVNQKTLLFQPCGSANVSVDLCMRNGIKLCQENGIKLLGGGVSRDKEFFTALASTKIVSAIQSIKNIMDLEDDQISTRLLESTQGVTKVNHLFRTISPDYMEDATILLSDKLKSAMRACLVGNAPGFGDLEFTLASLPNSKGGFGITDPHVLKKYAYIAAFISTKDAQSKLFPQLSNNITPEVGQMIEKYILNFPLVDRNSIKELILLPQIKKQKQLAMLLASEIRLATVQMWKTKHINDPYFHEKVLVLETATVPFTSLWQHVLPNSGLKQTMSNREFHTVCKMQLLIPIMKGGICIECGKLADPNGYHHVTCTGTCNLNHSRHQEVVHAYKDLSVVAGLHPVMDAPVRCLGVTNGVIRPADLLIDGDDNIRMCLDITIVSPFLSSAPRPLQVGKAAKDAEQKKYKKNAGPCELASFDFRACAADVLGVIPDTSYSFIKRLAGAYSARSGKPYADCLSICCRRICFSIRLGVARQLTASKMFLDNLFVDSLNVEG